MTQFFLSVHWEKKKMSHFALKSWVEFWFHQWLNFKGQNDSIFSLDALRGKIESFWPKKLSHLRQKHFNWKNIYCIGYPQGNGQFSIIAKAVNKQNYCYVSYILK